MLKLYAWEALFETRAGRVRRDEINTIRRQTYIRTALDVLGSSSLYLVTPPHPTTTTISPCPAPEDSLMLTETLGPISSNLLAPMQNQNSQAPDVVAIVAAMCLFSTEKKCSWCTYHLCNKCEGVRVWLLTCSRAAVLSLFAVSIQPFDEIAMCPVESQTGGKRMQCDHVGSSAYNLVN